MSKISYWTMNVNKMYNTNLEIADQQKEIGPYKIDEME